MPSTQSLRMPGKREFVVLMAALMASNALAIDAMLPALPAIGEALDVAEDNRRQLVITFYLLGFGAAQLVYGPIADRFGRKPLLIGCMAFYAVFAALAGLAGSFTLLLAARFAQGIAAAGSRVLVVAIVRDRFHGPAMAQIMSLTMIVFMIVPVLAPSLGQGVLTIGSWRHIFILLAGYGLALALWALAARARDAGRREQAAAVGGAYRRGDPRDADAARVDRQHRRLHARVRRPVRLHRLDPADRLRRLRPAGADRPRLRLHRRTDGDQLLCQFAAGDAARPAPTAARRADRLH